ncbi:MAG: hypothetical protein KDC84_12160 [Crocinitomicaceae bacterium]|nr:hypothetical protein [Crocinitomicaceae bacterium]
MKYIQKMEAVASDQIKKLDFPKQDVLLTEDDKMRREWKLIKAKDLGNSFLKTKTSFIVNTKTGYKKITGRVITFSKTKVILAGQRQIPVSSILDVKVLSNG